MSRRFVPILSAALLAALLSAPAAAAADALFADDFSEDHLASERYVRRNGFVHPRDEQPAWTVGGGRLRLETRGVKDSRLNVMAQAGERFTLTVRVRFSGKEGFAGGVSFCDDYRMGDGLYFGFFKGPGAAGLQTLGKGFDDWKDFPVEAGRWYAVKVARAGGRFVVSVDGAAQFEKTLAAPAQPAGKRAYDDDPLEHGGFALASRSVEKPYSVEWDDLKIEGAPARVPKLLKRTQLRLAGGPAQVNVLYYKGDEAWADKLIAEAPPWIANMEQIMGTPPCTDVLTWNQQRGTYFDQGAGFNEWGQILEGSVVQGIGGHEETHDWQHLYGQSWTNEGAADYFPWVFMAVRGKRRLRAAAMLGDARRLAERKGMLDFLLDKDPDTPPTAAGEVPLTLTTYGLKARLFWHILTQNVGHLAIQEMHRRAAAGKIKLKSGDVRRILEEITGKDLRPVFAGWVIAGATKYDVYGIARDGDGDGFSDLDEQIAGSDPAKPDSDGDGLADGFEWDHGLDPADGSDGAKWTEPIAADGLLHEWAKVPTVAVDDAGDGGGGPDVKSLRLKPSADGETVHAAIELHGRPAGNWYVQLDLAGADGKFTHRLNLWPQANRADYLSTADLKSIDLPAPVDFGATPEGLEVAIPLGPLGSPDRVTLAVIAGRHEGGHDRFNAPVTVKAKGAAGDVVQVDGDPAEWAEVPPTIEDPSGDASPDLKILKTRVSPDKKTLYFAIGYAGELPADAALQIDFDAAADGSWEYRIVGYPAKREMSYWSIARKAYLGDGGILFGVGKTCIELAVPIEKLDKPAKVAFNCMLHAGGRTDAIERFPVVELRE